MIWRKFKISRGFNSGAIICTSHIYYAKLKNVPKLKETYTKKTTQDTHHYASTQRTYHLSRPTNISDISQKKEMPKAREASSELSRTSIYIQKAIAR